MKFGKVVTGALAVAVVVLGGKVAFTTADAAAPSEPSKSTVQDWNARQPHMQKALEALAVARRALEEAAEHKGGWRVLALRHVDESIVETTKGIEYAKSHPQE
jgi:hypothetical protein